MTTIIVPLNKAIYHMLKGLSTIYDCLCAVMSLSSHSHKVTDRKEKKKKKLTVEYKELNK